MSSSADPGPADPELTGPPLGWDAFARREVPPVAGDFISPEGELVSLLQRHEQELLRSRERAVDDAARVREVIFSLAVFGGRLDQLTAEAEGPMAVRGLFPLHRQLRVLKDQMLQALTDDGIEVRDPTGLPVEQVMDWVDVTGWLHRDEFTEEVVAQTHERAVFHGGAVVRLARVLMGGPRPAGDDPGPPNDTATGPDTEPDEGKGEDQ
jgi:hypothetical protein